MNDATSAHDERPRRPGRNHFPHTRRGAHHQIRLGPDARPSRFHPDDGSRNRCDARKSVVRKEVCGKDHQPRRI